MDRVCLLPATSNTNQTILLIDDSRVVDAAHPLRPEMSEYPRHCDYLVGGTVVLMPAPERYVNACCDPTCVRWMSGRRHVVARRAIAAGEEITYDYLVDCHGGEVWQCWLFTVSTYDRLELLRTPP
jgi:hypothetical protein